MGLWTAMIRHRLRLRGGYALSMDPHIGELTADVLIEDGLIAAIEPDLGAVGCRCGSARSR